MKLKVTSNLKAIIEVAERFMQLVKDCRPTAVNQKTSQDQVKIAVKINLHPEVVLLLQKFLHLLPADLIKDSESTAVSLKLVVKPMDHQIILDPKGFGRLRKDHRRLFAITLDL